MKDARKLYRSTKDQRIAGVCSGLAEYLDTDVSIIRIIFLFAILLGGTAGLLYLIMWLVVPVEDEVRSLDSDKKE